MTYIVVSSRNLKRSAPGPQSLGYTVMFKLVTWFKEECQKIDSKMKVL